MLHFLLNIVFRHYKYRKNFPHNKNKISFFTTTHEEAFLRRIPPPPLPPRPRPGRRVEGQQRAAVPGGAERGAGGSGAGAAGVGPEDSEVRGGVRAAAAGGLRAAALGGPLRGEHILGERRRVDGGAGGGGVGGGAAGVRLPVEHVRGGAELRALHANRVEGDEEGRVRQSGVPKSQGRFRHLQLRSTGKLRRREALLISVILLLFFNHIIIIIIM